MDARKREKAWAADGAGSVMPAALATGGLFCVATHHRPDQHSGRGEEGMERLLLSTFWFSAYRSLGDTQKKLNLGVASGILFRESV